LRTDVRKGEKNGLQVVLSPSESEIQEAFQLYLVMMKKKYLPVLSSYSLNETEKRKTIVIKKDEKVVSYISYQLHSDIDKL